MIFAFIEPFSGKSDLLLVPLFLSRIPTGVSISQVIAFSVILRVNIRSDRITSVVVFDIPDPAAAVD